MLLTQRDQIFIVLLVVASVFMLLMALVVADQRTGQRLRVPVLLRATAQKLFIGFLIAALLVLFAAVLALPPKQYRVERTFDTVIVRTIVTGRDSMYYVELVRGQDTVPYQVPVFCDMGPRYIDYARQMTYNADTATAIARRLAAAPELAYTVKCPERTLSLSEPVHVNCFAAEDRGACPWTRPRMTAVAPRQ